MREAMGSPIKKKETSVKESGRMSVWRDGLTASFPVGDKKRGGVV
jgi:hypothetical protein